MEDIFFNEAEHRYYDADGINYTSVTTIINKYKKKYDGEFWSMFTALKNKNFKVTPYPEKRTIRVGQVIYKLKDLYKDQLFSLWAKAVQIEWEINKENACERGNITHNHLEDSINISKGDKFGTTNSLITPLRVKKQALTIHDLDTTDLKETYPEVYQRLSGYISRGWSIFAEKKVFLQEFQVAGMIDVPIFKGNNFCILDWKTNAADMHSTAGYYKKEKIGGEFVKTKQWVETGERMLYPLDNLEASKLNEYSMQLSIYAYILERWGYTLVPNGLEILHFPLESPTRLIKIPYLKKEAEILLNHHKLSMVA